MQVCWLDDLVKAQAIYKHKRDPKALREIYDTLTARYPQSDWAQRAGPYRGIEA